MAPYAAKDTGISACCCVMIRSCCKSYFLSIAVICVLRLGPILFSFVEVLIVNTQMVSMEVLLSAVYIASHLHLFLWL